MGGDSLFVFLNTSHLFDTTLPHFAEILNSFFAISEKILYKDCRHGFIRYDVGHGGKFWLLQYTAMVRYFRQVCRGRIVASRAVCPLNRIDGVIAAGGIYAAPTD